MRSREEMVPADPFARMLDAPDAPMPDAYIGDVPKWVPRSEMGARQDQFDVAETAENLLDNPVIQRIIEVAARIDQ